MSDDPKKPHLTLASSRSNAEWERERVQQELENALRGLAANLMRVVRGAGSPEYVYRQAKAVTDAFEAHLDRTGLPPSDFEVSQMLSLPEKGASLDGDEWESGIYQMLRGALRVTAARLLEQSNQASLGKSELIEGLAVIEDIRRKNREIREGLRPWPKGERPRL